MAHPGGKKKKKKTPASSKRRNATPDLDINEMIGFEAGRGEGVRNSMTNEPEDGVGAGVLSVCVFHPSALGDRSSASNNYDKLLFEFERMKSRCQEMQTAMVASLWEICCLLSITFIKVVRLLILLLLVILTETAPST